MECCFIILSIAKSRTIGGKKAWAASREERVFWNLAVPVWERKSFQNPFLVVDALKERLLVLVNFKILFSMEVKLLQVNTEWIERFFFYWLAVLLWPHLPWALCHKKRPFNCRGGCKNEAGARRPAASSWCKRLSGWMRPASCVMLCWPCLLISY